MPYVGWLTVGNTTWTMTSSMLAGERKWATARKGGMTVLGKVNVPKPLNLPSQRSENHGMDPNVAIVPKGTLSWGSRGYSSSSDAKNSSVSLNADGGVVSPRHRPSSGGGTRPSTAGSDLNHEPSGAWGSNSRPSSAAGTYPSNESALSSRPRSAETRPNSSQLSRFAEPDHVVKNSSAWGPDITPERLGLKQNGFSLNSGDFPTLGADRVDSTKNIEYEDHSRPTSASGTSVQPEKDPKSDTDIKRGSFGSWRMEELQGAHASFHPNMDKWKVDPTHYHHANVPPQHFDAWYGPPMNVPDVPWDQGHPRAPHFRPPLGPNGFPVEPFPYYRPQIPPPHLVGGAPRGPPPQNGNSCRPNVHHAYARPNMPYRPGFYHGPRGPRPFDGYCGPPMAYCNAEQDIPYMGVGAGHHSAYDAYPRAGAPNLGNLHGRPKGHYGNMSTETDDLEDSHREKRVQLRHERWDQKMVGENWEEKSERVILNRRKDYFPPMRINEMGISERTKEDAFYNRGVPGENLEGVAEHRTRAAENTRPNSFKVLGKMRTVKDGGSNKTEKVASFPTDMSQVHCDGVTDSSIPAGTKDSALMSRVSDVRDDESPLRDNIKEQNNRSHVEDQIIDDECINEVSINAFESLKKAPIFGDAPVSYESVQPVGAGPRRLGRDGHGGESYRGKGKLNSHGTDGWRRKGPHAGCSPSITSSTDFITANNPSDHNVTVEVFESNTLISNTEGDVNDSRDDSVIVQRVKMGELTKRALQRQKEEEARAREQKAKAFAKLEELNRRTLAGHHKPGDALPITQNQGEQSESETIEDKISESSQNIAYHSDATHGKRNTNRPVESVEDSQNLSSVILKTDLSVSASKDHILIGTIDITLPKGPLGETRVKEHAPDTSNALMQPTEPQRKKVSQSKHRNKMDFASTRTLSPAKNEKILGEKKESGSSTSNFDSSVQMGMPIRKISSPPSKDSVSRATNHWRNQQSRKLPKGPQANRATEKHHGNDIVVWAPVRTHTNKAEDGVVADRVSYEESTNQTRVDVKLENTLEGKRADMERYVAKAVVEAENPHSKDGFAETLESDGGRYNKHKKEHEVPKQWITADSSSYKRGDGHLMGPNKDVDLSKEQNESRNGENLSRNSEEARTSGGTTAVSSKHTLGKDQGMGRRKTQLLRGLRAMGYNTSSENISTIEVEGAVDGNRTERTISSSIEIQETAERSHSHWKPMPNFASRTSGSEKDPLEAAKAHKVHKHDKEIDRMSKTHQVEMVQRETDERSIDPNKEEKPLDQSKSTPFTPSSQDSTDAGGTTDHRLMHDGSSGFNKQRSQNNRSFRGHEFRAHNQRQNNTHYEYQPVDPSRSTEPRRHENPPAEGAESLDRKYHQNRGQSHPKHGGNYYRHQSRVDAGHD